MTTTSLAQIQLRRDTAANWTLANTTLASGEVGVETDTNLIKLGDGITAWSSLGYMPEQLAKQITSAASKAIPVDADEIPLADSAATFGLKKLTWANVKAALKTYFDTLYARFNGPTVNTQTASYVLLASDVGKRVVMNAAGATTITVDTSLFAASDTLEILNIGAGVCTITAGTATVSTAGTLALVQNAGGKLYFTSAAVSVFIPGGVISSTSTFIGAQLRHSVAQSIPDATQTAVNFDTEIVDTNGFHDNATNNTRLTIPAGKAGYYEITAACYFALNATGFRTLAIYKNGVIQRSSQYYAGHASAYIGPIIVYPLYLAATDYVEIFAYQNSGGALNADFTTAGNQGFCAMKYLGA